MRAKKRKWPWVLAGIALLFFLVWFFTGDEYEVPDYGNAFAPNQAQGIQGGNSSQFSAALDAIREGDGFAGHAGTGTGTSGGGSDYQDDIYAAIYNWTDDDWEDFWNIMYEYLDDDEMAYIINLDEDELIELVVSILSE